jgi:hypothetical protein
LNRGRNLSPSTCSRKPWASGRARNLQREEFAFARSARFLWRWDLDRRARSILQRGT